MFTVKIDDLIIKLIHNDNSSYFEQSVKIAEVKGDCSRIRIPDAVAYEGTEYVITAIGKKAFMGLKNLKEISLPGTVILLEDWSFAQCTHLTSFAVREQPLCEPAIIVFERGVFDGCSDIRSICLGYEVYDDRALLLGAAAYQLPASYLFRDPELGKDAWYENWDKSLVQFLNSPDDEGSTDRVLCGEEDISYDGIGSVDGELLADGTNYVEERIISKCRLCFLRLKASSNLNKKYEDIFVSYLRSRGKGTETECAWKVLRDYYTDNIEYFKLYNNYGLLDIDMVDDMLEDIGEKHAEAKAFLIDIKQKHYSVSDYFSSLLL